MKLFIIIIIIIGIFSYIFLNYLKPCI